MKEKKHPFRIGFFIDGFTFYKVNYYYKHYHEQHSRICFAGLRNFVMKQVRPYCPPNRPIVLEAHYYHAKTNPHFRNPNRIDEGLNRFEERLLEEGFKIHYPGNDFNNKKNGNADLINDLKMYALFQEIDIAVLLSTQGFYSNVAATLKTQKIPLFLLGWNFSYTNENNTIFWKTDVELRQRAFQYIAMEKIMNSPNQNKISRSLFVSSKKRRNHNFVI